MGKCMDLIGIATPDKPHVSITWQVNDVCNFKCSYCNEGNWGGRYRNLSTERYIKVLDKIIDSYQQKGYEKFKLFFSGGEPTIWPPLKKIINFVREKTTKSIIAVNTNLSRPQSWWEKNYELFDDIVASFHIEFTNQNRYLENLKFLQDKMPYICCRLLLHDDRFAEVLTFANKLKESLQNYRIEYAPLLQELTPHSLAHAYTESWKKDALKNLKYEQKIELPIQRHSSFWGVGKSYYSDGSIQPFNSNDLVSFGKNNFKDWTCHISESIYISPKGEITMASCGVGGRVGNINDDHLDIKTTPVTCPHTLCNCGTDVALTKFNPRRFNYATREQIQSEVQP